MTFTGFLVTAFMAFVFTMLIALFVIALTTTDRLNEIREVYELQHIHCNKCLNK